MEEFKTTPEEFNNMLLNTLEEFHKFQNETPRPPYAYNTLGLAEWLEFNYFKAPPKGSEK